MSTSKNGGSRSKTSGRKTKKPLGKVEFVLKYGRPLIEANKYTRPQIVKRVMARAEKLIKNPDDRPSLITCKAQIYRSLRDTKPLNRWGLVAKEHPDTKVIRFTKIRPKTEEEKAAAKAKRETARKKKTNKR